MTQNVRKFVARINPAWLLTAAIAAQVGVRLIGTESWAELTTPSAVGELLVAVAGVFGVSLARSVVKNES